MTELDSHSDKAKENLEKDIGTLRKRSRIDFDDFFGPDLCDTECSEFGFYIDDETAGLDTSEF